MDEQVHMEEASHCIYDIIAAEHNTLAFSH
jgi:hypothetical protein